LFWDGAVVCREAFRGGFQHFSAGSQGLAGAVAFD